MNENLINKNTSAWRFQVWTIFAISVVGTVLGITYLAVDVWIKAFLAMGYVSSVSACFTLSKTIRDDFEAEKLINRISSAKTEKILTEYE